MTDRTTHFSNKRGPKDSFQAGSRLTVSQLSTTVMTALYGIIILCMSVRWFLQRIAEGLSGGEVVVKRNYGWRISEGAISCWDGCGDRGRSLRHHKGQRVFRSKIFIKLPAV